MMYKQTRVNLMLAWVFDCSKYWFWW